MKTLWTWGFCLAMVLSCVAGYAQPPLWQLTSDYEINSSPDTLWRYTLIDLNQDSIADLLCSTRDSIWAFDGSNGSLLSDPIPAHRRRFVFAPYRESDSVLNILLAYSEGVVQDSQLFKIIHFPISSPEERDSLIVAVSIIHAGDFTFYEGISFVLPFDVGSDGIGEFLIFYNYNYYNPTLGGFDAGYLMATNLSGTLIADTRRIDRLIKVLPFKIGQASAISIMSNWASDDYSFQSLKTLDDSLRLINEDVVSGGNFKYLKDADDGVVKTLHYAWNNVSVYNGPFLDNGLTRSFPCNAIPTFYSIEDSLYILTGCPNSYFELRDLEWNLMAFVWGPNISISSADAIDIDRDGTDELLCRTATGFVLYRLDTTATYIAYGDPPLPEEPALSAYPNPFNAKVSLSLAGFEGEAEISIYDIAGRLVRRLTANSSHAVWDGRAEGGGEVESGVYFVRATAGDQDVSIKIVLLK